MDMFEGRPSATTPAASTVAAATVLMNMVAVFKTRFNSKEE
jgi:hypothetical protein